MLVPAALVFKSNGADWIPSISVYPLPQKSNLKCETKKPIVVNKVPIQFRIDLYE